MRRPWGCICRFVVLCIRGWQDRPHPCTSSDVKLFYKYFIKTCLTKLQHMLVFRNWRTRMERRIFETRDDSRPLERTERSHQGNIIFAPCESSSGWSDGHANYPAVTMDQLLVFVFWFYCSSTSNLPAPLYINIYILTRSYLYNFYY